MIQINRGAMPSGLAAFTKKTVKAADGVTKITRAEREAEQALSFFTNAANYSNNEKLTAESFMFSVYKDKELVAALEAAFGAKCAYCESRFAHVTPKDIEHFRPKSEIATANGVLRPGYFWLAADWDNLLVSCPDCNRARNHEVPGQPAKLRLGKETQFPLANEAMRVRSRGAVLGEEPVRLILHPCIDQPEQHLTFDVQGLVRARINGQGVVSEMGNTSITVYALQRKPLVEERLRVLNGLRLLVEQLAFLVKNHNDLKALGASAQSVDENSNQIRAVRDGVRAIVAKDAPYLGMVREWIRESHSRGEFASLLQFGIDLSAMV